MELVFVQSPSGWECEVEVTAEFNLHIERGGVGRLLLYQKTPGGGKYDRVRDFNVGNGDNVIDYDSGSFIAPKTIKIVSEVEPTYAAITFANTSSGGSESGGSADEDVIFFDASAITSANMYDLSQMIPALMMNSAFINKTTFYAESYAGRLPFSELSITGLLDVSNIYYFAVNNSLTPTVVMMGSGSAQIPEQDGPITFYEFIELLNEMGIASFPIDEFKAAEVSRDVVEEWLNAQ